MVEVYDKHGRYEKMWLNSLCVMSNVKDFCHAQDGRLAASWPNMTCNLDIYDTHLDQQAVNNISICIP